MSAHFTNKIRGRDKCVAVGQKQSTISIKENEILTILTQTISDDTTSSLIFEELDQTRYTSFHHHYEIFN